MTLSLQLSKHMQSICCNLLRVSGVEGDPQDSGEQSSLRKSFGVQNKGHLVDFDELSEHYEEEGEYNTWRESILDEDVLSEGRVFSAHMSLRNSLDLDCCAEEEEFVSDRELEDEPKLRTMPSKKWLSADALSKKVMAMYNAIRNKTMYNVTNGMVETVVKTINRVDFVGRWSFSCWSYGCCR